MRVRGPVLGLAAVALLAGCASVERETVTASSSLIPWSVAVSPYVEPEACLDDPAVDTTTQPAVMPPMSVTFVLTEAANEADAERVADCVEGLLSGGSITILRPGVNP